MSPPRPKGGKPGEEPTGVVVKLGGSLITDKRGDRPRIRRQTLARLAAELASAPRGTLVGLVHGAGSFGHGPVLRAGLHEGLRGGAPLADQRLAWGEIQVLQNELNAAVCRAMQSQGIPAVPCQPSAAAVLKGRRLVCFFEEVVVGLAAVGMVPVLFGVPALDRVQGCAILSGDVLAPELARCLGARRLLYATDVDGVFTADPRTEPTAERIPSITPGNWPRVQAALCGSQSVDVTGGMAGKVAALLSEVVRHRLEARILDGRRQGHLAAALAGRPVGTLVGP